MIRVLDLWDFGALRFPVSGHLSNGGSEELVFLSLNGPDQYGAGCLGVIRENHLFTFVKLRKKDPCH